MFPCHYLYSFHIFRWFFSGSLFGLLHCHCYSLLSLKTWGYPRCWVPTFPTDFIWNCKYSVESSWENQALSDSFSYALLDQLHKWNNVGAQLIQMQMTWILLKQTCTNPNNLHFSYTACSSTVKGDMNCQSWGQDRGLVVMVTIILSVFGLISRPFKLGKSLSFSLKIGMLTFSCLRTTIVPSLTETGLFYS